jgi:hypothetical protein
MSIIHRRSLKRGFIDDEVDVSSSKKIKFYQQDLKQSTLQLKNRKKIRREYHCQVYLKLYPTTSKCTLDVIVKSTNDIIDDHDSILLAKTRIGKLIKPGRMLNLIKK